MCVDLVCQHHRLLTLLYDIATELGADIRFGCHVSQLGADGRSIILESGETLSADIVVGAESVQGLCRSAIVPNDAEEKIGDGFMLYWYASNLLQSDLGPHRS